MNLYGEIYMEQFEGFTEKKKKYLICKLKKSIYDLNKLLNDLLYHLD